MEVHISHFDKLKIIVRSIGHRYTQYRLTTNETIERQTKYGPVRGLKRKTLYDEDHYYAFESIPYAKPPLGDLRFRAPQPPEPWTEVRDCTTWRSKPFQHNLFSNTVEGTEDCLYLNVYAKNLESKKPLPVLVWIYGGGFQMGEATRDMYAPDYFMQQDVVLVTLNYRLGALGFLSLKDADIGVPGNAGLKDQLLALRWVKENIANFNGDAENITLFGESAGAASVHFLMLSNSAKGLFHKAIVQSGSALCPWAISPQRNWAFRLAISAGYKGTNNEKEIFRFLSNVEANKLVVADSHLLTADEKRERILFAFSPVVEPYVSENCILSKPPKDLLSTAWSNEIPLIIGGTSFEGLFLYQNTMHKPHMINELGDCIDVLPPELKLKRDAAELKEMGLRLKHAYFGTKEPNRDETLWEYLDLASYQIFWHGIQRTIHARRGYAPNANTYLYRFDFDSPDFNHIRALFCGKSVRGVAHGDDLMYLFYGALSWKLPKESLEYKTIERFVGLWTAFAATSNPNSTTNGISSWESVNKDAPVKCLNISAEIEFINSPEAKKLLVWDGLYHPEELY